MYNENSISEFVFSMSNSEFALLQVAVNQRINKEKFGANTIEELAIKDGRNACCPSCGSTNIHKDGVTQTKVPCQKYECNKCGHRFTLLSDSIFNSMKLNFNQICLYTVLMTFNVPLAMLWRKKIFSTVDNYQENIVLKDTVWIDEFYIYDYSILHEDGYKQKRGLSKDQLCLIVGIDCYKT